MVIHPTCTEDIQRDSFVRMYVIGFDTEKCEVCVQSARFYLQRVFAGGGGGNRN